MKAYSLLSKCLQIICAITVGIVFIFNFIFNTTVSYDLAETVRVENHIAKSILFLIVIAITLFAVSFLNKFIQKIKTKYLFLVFSAVYILMAVYLICNVDHSLRFDPHEVAQAAKNFLGGTAFSFHKGDYIYQYPHQIGLMLFDAFLFLFSKNTVIIFIANITLVLAINFMIYKISDLIFENQLTSNISVILSFAFLPQFFFILFAYGTIPGLFFLLFALYHALRFCKTHSYVNLILTVIGGCVAVMLRKNLLIGIVAIVIFICLDLLKKFSFKHLILIALIFISLILPLKILPCAFVGSGNGAPSVLWIAMGTDIDNTHRGPGWYDGTSDYIFSSSDYNAEVSAERGKEKLIYNIQRIKEEPLKAGKFFTKKVISQWCDPLYQSLWSGPLEDYNQHTKTPLLRSLYTGGFAENLLSNGMKLYTMVFFGFALVFVIKYHKKYYGWQLCFLIFIGGFIFHIFWEAKSQYVYPYFFALIPFVAFPLSKALVKIESLIQGAKHKKP